MLWFISVEVTARHSPYIACQTALLEWCGVVNLDGTRHSEKSGSGEWWLPKWLENQLLRSSPVTPGCKAQLASETSEALRILTWGCGLHCPSVDRHYTLLDRMRRLPASYVDLEVMRGRFQAATKSKASRSVSGINHQNILSSHILS